jgi:putative DNA primase/helicase
MMMIDHALGFASRGWPVFPCHPVTKQPLVKSDIAGEGGLKLATTD